LVTERRHRPAAIWAVYALSQYNTDKKIEKAMGGGA